MKTKTINQCHCVESVSRRTTQKNETIAAIKWGITSRIDLLFLYLLSHAMSLSNVLVNVASFKMSKSNSWHDFIGTVSSFLFISLCISMLFFSCAQLSDEELWIKIEQAKANNNWDSTMQVSLRILKEYPNGQYGGWAQFALAESYRFKNQPREALDNYKLFYEQHPDMQPSALSLFLTGYIYNNNLQVYDSAKIFYEQFLLKYPNHDLAPTVKFELASLGKSPQDALNEKERTTKPLTKK